MPDWVIRSTTGDACPFHHLEPNWSEPTIWWHRIERPALILGSSQTTELIHPDATAAGWEICKRRSGGGLVVLRPHDHVWIDVFIPRGHRLFVDDLSRSFDTIGRAWAGALADHGVRGLSIHTGPLARSAQGRLFCYAGVGPGEVFAQGSKVVGLSQRRTRDGSRVQTMALITHQIDDVRPLVLGELGELIDNDQLGAIGLPAGSPPIAPEALAASALDRLGNL